jgi:hypothetical protein
LQIHLRQRFLHSLNAGRCPRYVFCPLPPVGAKNANLGWWLERVIQQPVGVQLQQPLTLLHVALTSRQVLRVSRIDQIHFKATVFQNLVEGNPIHPSRLQGDRLYSTALQPFRQTVQVCGKTLKPAYRFWISVWPHGSVMRAVPHIDSCRMRMKYFQSRIFRSQSPGPFFPLLPVPPQLVACRHRCSPLAGKWNPVRAGDERFRKSPQRGQRAVVSTALATMPAIASTGAMLLTGHKGTSGKSALARRTESSPSLPRTAAPRQVSGTSDCAQGAINCFL